MRAPAQPAQYPHPAELSDTSSCTRGRALQLCSLFNVLRYPPPPPPLPSTTTSTSCPHPPPCRPCPGGSPAAARSTPPTPARTLTRGPGLGPSPAPSSLRPPLPPHGPMSVSTRGCCTAGSRASQSQPLLRDPTRVPYFVVASGAATWKVEVEMNRSTASSYKPMHEPHLKLPPPSSPCTSTHTLHTQRTHTHTLHTRTKHSHLLTRTTPHPHPSPAAHADKTLPHPTRTHAAPHLEHRLLTWRHRCSC